MPTVIPVKFQYASRDLWFDPCATGAQEGDHVICSTERGQEIGLVTADAEEVELPRLRQVLGDATLRPVIRIATVEDLDRADELARQGEAAFPTFRRLAHESGLDMKPVGVEYLFGGGKVVCYFSAEERVDFRQLVRDLSRELHERIDMRQIGVREEAAIVGGYGHCGQELCCARFGRQFEPVSIRMAKEQDLPLNALKISGACGRLMCCLRYEFEAYADFKGRAPKRNAVIQTPLGKAKIVEYDTPKEQIALRLESGKQIRVPLGEMVASDAAHKKSEELHCPCRPDTVTRETLEKLQSPDVQMALAELDRKNGVVPQETYDESDLFVESRPKRRRRGQASQQGGQGQQSGGQGQGAGRRRRRSGHEADAGSAAPQAQGQGQASRRHRRKTVEPGEATPTAAPQQTAGEGTHRRRHHQASEAAGAQGQARQGQAGSQQQRDGAAGEARQGQRPKGMQPSRRRRHPGDHGGDASQASQAPRDARPSQPADGQDGRPKRRRTHRGGRGNGGGNGGNAGGSGPQGGAPTGE